MSRHTLAGSRYIKQFSSRHDVRMYVFNSENALRKRACLIEDHCSDSGELFHIACALNEDSFARGASDSAKKRERYRHNKRARTRYNKKNTGSRKPYGRDAPIRYSEKNRRDNRKKYSSGHHAGCIPPGKSRYKILNSRLLLR